MRHLKKKKKMCKAIAEGVIYKANEGRNEKCVSKIRVDGAARLKGRPCQKASPRSCEHLQIHVSRQNLTLRVDKRSLCRNCIFPDECKHRSECVRSKERYLCAVTFSFSFSSVYFVRWPTPWRNANTKIFS